MRAALHVPGHFGEWLQGRIGSEGPIALVSLPAPGLGVTASMRPGGPRLALSGAGLSPSRARRFLLESGLTLTGRVHLRSMVDPGLGTGVSTAALVALARLASWAGPPEALARACIAVEGASDPLMFPSPERLLWASRRGAALAELPPLPRYDLLGGFCGGPSRTDPRDADFADISDLVVAWRRAPDLATCAALASESAARCSARRGPAEETAPDLAQELGALGWIRAHTGAARGLIFAPGTIPAGAAAAVRAAGWRGLRRITGGER